MFDFSASAILAAQNAAPSGPGPGGPQQLIASIVPFILIFIIMYLLLIRPQQKKQQEHRELISRLKAGDRVMTTGGIYGTITAVSEKTVTLKVAENVEIEVARVAVASVLESASLPAAGASSEKTAEASDGRAVAAKAKGKNRGSGSSGRKRR